MTSSTTDQVVRVKSANKGKSASDAAPSGPAHARSIASQSSKYSSTIASHPGDLRLASSHTKF